MPADGRLFLRPRQREPAVFRLLVVSNMKVRDLRKKDQYKIDDAYLNGYARICGIYATAVYNSLSRHADFHTQEAFPSIEKIAEQHNISRPSVIKGIKSLESWGIIKVAKEKDEKTKRQKVNIYYLVDKSEWKPKPSRVNEIDTESRVNLRSEPSQSQNKSRVNEIDCKDTQFKDTQLRLAKQSFAGKDINDILFLFEKLNPGKSQYANKSQRAAVERLVEKFGVEKITTCVSSLPAIITQKYAPTITSPIQLENKLGELIVFMKKSQNKIKGRNIIV